MVQFFKKLLGGRPPKAYAEQKEDLQAADVKRRLSLASDTKTNREILYYLAEHDPDPKVRRAVVENKSMPVQVSAVLAVDPNADVRLALAARLVVLLPELSKDEHSQVYAFAVQALGTLALDEVLKIRKALSSTLKDHAQAPPKVAGQLARDVEREVSEPVLRFCSVLSDSDLLDILSAHPEGWVVRAIAGRDMVSEPVCRAVIRADDVPAGSVLIVNEGAQIGENLLKEIVDRARTTREWQKPVALRKSLPLSVAKEMAGFVDASVRDILLRRGDFDASETEEIAAVFRRRVDFATGREKTDETPAEKLRRIVAEDSLGEQVISDALAMRDYEFVECAIAHLARTQLPIVEKVFALKAAKPIVALSWHAGLSMRMALQLQQEMGHVPPKELIYPRDGKDYPMTREEIDWQLEFLGLRIS